MISHIVSIVRHDETAPLGGYRYRDLHSFGFSVTSCVAQPLAQRRWEILSDVVADQGVDWTMEIDDDVVIDVGSHLVDESEDATLDARATAVVA